MPRVVIVGQDEALTRLLAAGLKESPAVESCLDVRPGDGQRLDGDAFVVVPGEKRGFPDVESTVLLAAGLRGAGHVVLVSSAAVNEPSHRHPGLVSEERLAGRRTGNALAARWRELEEKVGSVLQGIALTVLRPTALVVPGGRDFWSRLLAGRLAFTVPGFDPTVQLLDAGDFTAAVRGLNRLWRSR